MLLHKTFQKYHKSHIPSSDQGYEHRAKECQPTSPSSGEGNPLLWGNGRHRRFPASQMETWTTTCSQQRVTPVCCCYFKNISAKSHLGTFLWAYFGSSVTYLICALQGTEETDCSSFHKKLRNVSLERQRALYSNAHTHPAARHPNCKSLWGCQPGCRISVLQQKYYCSHQWANPCIQSHFGRWISDNICYFHSFFKWGPR